MVAESRESQPAVPAPPGMVEVVTRFKGDAGVRLVGTELTSVTDADVTPVRDRLARVPGSGIRRMFDQTEEGLLNQTGAIATATGFEVPDWKKGLRR